jgi:hypothetical protein
LVAHKFKQKVLNFCENSHMGKQSNFWYVTGRPGSTARRKRSGRCARDRQPPSSRWARPPCAVPGLLRRGSHLRRGWRAPPLAPLDMSVQRQMWAAPVGSAAGSASGHAWLAGEDSNGGSSTSCWTEGNLVLYVNTEPASGPQAAADVEKGKLVGVEEL